MKKNTWIFIVVVLFASVHLVYAEGMKDGMMDKGMMGKGMMAGKMMGNCPMMKSMMERTIIATSDGGIVIAMGNKITKYDKDLNLIKDVELNMDMEGMHKMMESMKGMCPMMGKGMMGDKDQDTGVKAEPAAAEKEADHSSHH